MNTLFNMIWLAVKYRRIKTAEDFFDPIFSFVADYTKEVAIITFVFSLIFPILLYVIFRRERVVVWTYVILTLLILAFIFLVVGRVTD